MSVITNRVVERIVTGMNFGGQIPRPIINELMADALDGLYELTGIVKVELPIDEVADECQYDLPVMDTGRICRTEALHRITFKDAVEVSRVALDEGSYAIGVKVDATASLGSIQEIINMSTKSSVTQAGGLCLVVVAAFPSDDFIPSMHAADAEIAVASKVMEMLSLNTGKPWSNVNKATTEAGSYARATNRMRIKTARGNTSRDLTMRSSVSFI